MRCPECKKRNMKIKTSKVGSLFIACMGFPDCKHTLSLPKCLESIIMTDEECKNCRQRTNQPVKKFRLDFVTDFVNESMAEVLPDDDNTSGVFCIAPTCDPNFKILLD
jgi:ssDNA-binding Zn-finger/Zn-ribbon topoisomerase 1